MRPRLIGGIAALVLMFSLSIGARAVGPITSIEISPSTATAAAGSKVTFTVIGKDADGVTADLTTNSTFTTSDSKGSMAANVYTAGAAGSSTVRAKYSTFTSDATVTVTAGPVDEVVVNPNSDPERIANGQTRNFLADVFDAFNNPIASFTVDWSVEGDIGTITSTANDTGKFSATKEGNGRVVAKVGTTRGFVDVTVSQLPTTTNTNASTNTNTSVPATNANRNSNTNAATNTNTDGNSNTNTDANVNAAANTNSSSSAADTACNPWSRSTWVWLYVAYVAILTGSLWAVRRSKPSWWWVIPFLLTVGMLWMYFQYRCYPVYPGLPYLVLLAAVVGASWYTWQRGNKTLS